MTLLDIVADLEHFGEDDTIYAAQPWSRDARAVVAREPDGAGAPEEAAALGFDYFLEVSIARDFLADWRSSLQSSPSLEASCERIIRYARDDA